MVKLSSIHGEMGKVTCLRLWIMTPKNYRKAFLISACFALIAIVTPTKAQTTDVAIVRQPALSSNGESEKDMAQLRHEIAEEMKAQDVQLMKLIAQMNEASGDKKLEMMGNIITQVVQQRSDRDARMELMQERVMQYMIAAGSREGKPLIPSEDKESK